MRLCLGTHLHCPELPNGKMSSAKTDTFLAIENWAWRGDSRHQHEQNHQWQPDRQRKQNTSNAETSLAARGALLPFWLLVDMLPPLVTRLTSGRKPSSFI